MSKENPGRRKRDITAPPQATAPVRLPSGWASAVVSAGKLAAVEWKKERAELLAVLAEKYPGVGIASAEKTPEGRFLLDYAAGKVMGAKEIMQLSIPWESVPGFHRAVLRLAAAIPYGRTATYGELAKAAGNPRACRAAGTALARNPWPIIVPCHRVVAAGGKPGGFGLGPAVKQSLLGFEGRKSGRKNKPII